MALLQKSGWTKKMILLVTGFLMGRQVRQDRLDRALLAAIKKEETEKALRLLEQGANPNAVTSCAAISDPFAGTLPTISVGTCTNPGNFSAEARASAPRIVGWVERSESHHLRRGGNDGFRFALPHPTSDALRVAEGQMCTTGNLRMSVMRYLPVVPI